MSGICYYFQSEVMSDDEESMTGSLRKIQIPIPALSCSQQKRLECRLLEE